MAFLPPNPKPSALHRDLRRRLAGSVLRPGRVPRKFYEPCLLHVQRFQQWARSTPAFRLRSTTKGLALEVVQAAAMERGATLGATVPAVMAVLRRLRHQYPLDVALQTRANARLALRVLRALKPAMRPSANGAWRLNRDIVRVRAH